MITANFKAFIGIIIMLAAAHMAKAQISATFLQPTQPEMNNGSITFHGLSSGKEYIIRMDKDGEPMTPFTIKANAATEAKVDSLWPGVYDNIIVGEGSTATKVPDRIILSRIAVQETQFSGAIYTNFTGIADDDPKDFTQYYAMLSQPLRKIYGINSYEKKRLILLRNLFFQLTYGNTDKFKLYSYDSLNNKYVNRLDLFAHAYLDAKMSLNLMTFVFPSRRKPTYGDHSHLYLDGTLGFLSTNVTDTLTKDSSATTQSVHSLMAGWDAAIKFEKIFGSNFQIQTGFKMFWIFTHTGTFNPLLNPQFVNVSDRKNAQNITKSIERKRNYPFYAIDVLISYNISGDPEKNSSNVFLHYCSSSNLARVFGDNYPNYYFQFQFGIDLQVNKIFATPK